MARTFNLHILIFLEKFRKFLVNNQWKSYLLNGSKIIHLLKSSIFDTISIRKSVVGLINETRERAVTPRPKYEYPFNDLLLI
jgi:hypothetical protein